MGKITFTVLAVILALGAWWALAATGVTPSRRCGTSLGPNGPSDVCYWATEERVF